MVRRKRIRELVQHLLLKHEVRTVPVDVKAIARAEGLEIRRESFGVEFSGLLYRDGKKAFIALSDRDKYHPRQRFTIAHELGHYVLGHDAIHIDQVRPSLGVLFRDRQSETGTDEQEIEANLFAAELLMPREFLERDVFEVVEFDTDEAIRRLANDYQVSIQAMTIRLTNLGYLTV